MAKAPKSAPEPGVLECDVSVEQIDKAIKHLQGRLRHLIIQSVFTTGEAGMVARTVQDLQALSMVTPLLGSQVEKPKPKPPTREEALKEQKAAHARHKQEEDLESYSR